MFEEKSELSISFHSASLSNFDLVLAAGFALFNALKRNQRQQ
jgi:hypothetical protein